MKKIPLGHYDTVCGEMQVSESMKRFANIQESHVRNELDAMKIVNKALKDPLLKAYGYDIAWDIGRELGAGQYYTELESDVLRKGLQALEKMRNLNYRDSRWLTPRKWADLMSVATPYGYNEFDVVKVYQGLAGESNLKVQGARESSVCMYVKGFKNYDQVVMFGSAMKRARVDEFAMLDKGGRPILRSWNVQDYMNVVDKGARANEYKLPADFKEIRCWWD